MRREGYYWVKYRDDTNGNDVDDWNIRYWNGEMWIVPIDDYTSDDNYFERIDENRIERDEFAAHKLGYTPDQL